MRVAEAWTLGRVATRRAQATTDLQEHHELALGLRITLDIALRHGEAGVARELLHISETPQGNRTVLKILPPL